MTQPSNMFSVGILIAQRQLSPAGRQRQLPIGDRIMKCQIVYNARFFPGTVSHLMTSEALTSEAPKVQETSTPLYVRIAENIREEILNGVLEPGQHLQEQHLAERYGVSRVPVRDALRRLEAERLIHVEANRGAFVSRVTAEEAAELLRVRLILEELLCHDAAKNRTEAQLQELREIVVLGTSSVRGASPSQLVALNTRFHRLLGEASHNPTAAGLVEQLRKRSELEYAGRLPKRAESSWKEHQAVFDAVEAGDPEEAARCIREHLTHAAAAWDMDITK